MSSVLVIAVPTLIILGAAYLVYLFLVTGRVKVSADGAGRSCPALLYAGRGRPSWQVRLEVTPDWLTAYVPFFRARAYRRGQRGLADASMFGCRVHESQIRELRSIGVANGVKVTDHSGRSVFLYGRNVPATLAILGSGQAPRGHPDPRSWGAGAD